MNKIRIENGLLYTNKMKNGKQDPYLIKELIGLPTIEKDKNGLFLSVRTISESVKSFGGTQEELELISSLIIEHHKKAKTLLIFKDLQKANPIFKPKELWETAKETYSLLESESIIFEY